MGLHGRKTRWLDDKANELKRHAAIGGKILSEVGRKTEKKNSSTEEKHLCKKEKSDVLADNVGTFQNALSRSLSSLNSKKSKIHLTILVQCAGLMQM